MISVAFTVALYDGIFLHGQVQLPDPDAAASTAGAKGNRKAAPGNKMEVPQLHHETQVSSREVKKFTSWWLNRLFETNRFVFRVRIGGIHYLGWLEPPL